MPTPFTDRRLERISRRLEELRAWRNAREPRSRIGSSPRATAGPARSNSRTSGPSSKHPFRSRPAQSRRLGRRAGRTRTLAWRRGFRPALDRASGRAQSDAPPLPGGRAARPAAKRSPSTPRSSRKASSAPTSRNPASSALTSSSPPRDTRPRTRPDDALRSLPYSATTRSFPPPRRCRIRLPNSRTAGPPPPTSASPATSSATATGSAVAFRPYPPIGSRGDRRPPRPTRPGVCPRPASAGTAPTGRDRCRQTRPRRLRARASSESNATIRRSAACA